MGVLLGDRAQGTQAGDAVRGFLEAGGGEGSVKVTLYSREPARAIKYRCPLHSTVANWRDASTHWIAAAMFCLNMANK